MNRCFLLILFCYPVSKSFLTPTHLLFLSTRQFWLIIIRFAPLCLTAMPLFVSLSFQFNSPIIFVLCQDWPNFRDLFQSNPAVWCLTTIYRKIVLVWLKVQRQAQYWAHCTIQCGPNGSFGNSGFHSCFACFREARKSHCGLRRRFQRMRLLRKFTF